MSLAAVKTFTRAHVGWVFQSSEKLWFHEAETYCIDYKVVW